MPVTYSQVEAAANTLVSLGKKATVRAVRDQVGGGANFNEFMVHLDVWKEKRPAKPVQQPQLPPSLTNALAAEIIKAASEARVEGQIKLDEAIEDIDSLAAENKALASDGTALKQQIVELTSERDAARAIADQLGADLGSIQQALVEKAAEAESARKSEAIAVVNAENAKAHVVEKQTTIVDLLNQLQASNNERRVLSESMAVKSSELSSNVQRLHDAKSQLTDANSRINALEAQLQKERDLRTEAQATTATASAQAAERAARISQLERDFLKERDTRVLVAKKLADSESVKQLGKQSERQPAV